MIHLTKRASRIRNIIHKYLSDDSDILLYK